MSKYYLAYGSNLNLTKMKDRCPSSKFVCQKKIFGKELVFKGENFGYLTLEDSSLIKCVPVGIFLIDENDEKNLDVYEGYPDFYHKEIIPIKIHGEIKEAMTYVMNEEFTYTLPTKMYYSVCLEGYKDHGFNRKYLEKALDKTCKKHLEEQKIYKKKL